MQVLLKEAGHSLVSCADEATLIIVNGCSVREKAVHKALSSLGRFKDQKKAYKDTLIGVGGCVAQLDKANLFQKAPHVDFVFGTDAIDQLPEIVFRAQQGEKRILSTQFDALLEYSTQTRLSEKRVSAFVNIMKGCDKYCTYCIVPFTRGKEKSRTIDEVLDDLAQLVAQGVKEVTLLGQNVNSFGKGNKNSQGRSPEALTNQIGRVGPHEGDENFPMLLEAIEKDPRLGDLKRIRFTSSHPLDFSDQLIESYGTVSKLAAHLHLPVQSGSNAILKKMGRHHTIQSYMAQMQRLRALRPDVALSTDLIVGFPGETLQDFEATLQLLESMQFDLVYAFCYSVRPGTRAAKLMDDVPDEEKKRRLQIVLDKQRAISAAKNEEKVGTTMLVLVENLAKTQQLQKKDTFVWTGRTSCNRIVNFVSPVVRSFLHQFIALKIVRASASALQGELVL
jgi:tRNA-2-methylthio-N6-dimethylallyladenosine synthase